MTLKSWRISLAVSTRFSMRGYTDRGVNVCVLTNDSSYDSYRDSKLIPFDLSSAKQNTQKQFTAEICRSPTAAFLSAAENNRNGAFITLRCEGPHKYSHDRSCAFGPCRGINMA